jgi:hypothetical protein
MVNIMAPTPPQYEWYWTAAMVEFMFLQSAILLKRVYVLIAVFSPICDIYFASNLGPQCYHVGANRSWQHLGLY